MPEILVPVPPEGGYDPGSWKSSVVAARPAPVPYPGEGKVPGQFYTGSGTVWFCESYDQRYGYWMTEVDAATFEGKTDGQITNVSERAIGRTFHRTNPPRGSRFNPARG